MKFKNGNKYKPMFGVATGLVVALVMTVSFAMVISLLLINGSLAESSMTIAGYIAQLLACSTGFVVAGKLTGERIAICIGACVAAYFVLMVAVGLLILDSRFSVNWGTIIVTLIGYVLACAICIRNGKSKKRRKSPSR